MRFLPRVGLAAAVVALLVGAIGCGSQSSGSRHELFESLEEIEAASTMIVVGEVIDQAMGDEVTVSTIVVEESFRPAALATASDIAPSAPADTVQVRTIRPASASSPLLSAGCDVSALPDSVDAARVRGRSVLRHWGGCRHLRRRRGCIRPRSVRR